MSDFLSQFDKENYNKNNVEINISKPQKEEKVSGIAPTEHETVIDKNYNKAKIIRYSIICGTIIVILILGFIGFRLLNRVTVKNFVGSGIGEAKTWGLKNKIEFDITYEYNIEYGNDVVASQDIEPQKKIQKGSIIYLVVSKGADPEERIELPDFSEMKIDEVRKWISENKTQSVNIMQEYDETIELGEFIKMEFRDPTIDATNFKRKDGLIIYMSKGPEKVQNNIQVPDFTGKAKMEVETWASTNEINVTYKEIGSEKITEQCVISQSVKSGEYLARKDAMAVEVSIGKGVKVPDFNTVPMQNATMYNPELIVTMTSKYSGTVSYGKVISQSVKSGTTLYGDNKKVSVVYSEGRPYIDDLRMKTEKDIAPYFYEFNSKGTNITYGVIYEISSEVTKGSVIYASKCNEFVDMTTYIEIHVSLGDLEAEEND